MKKTAVTQLIEQLTAVGALEIPEGTNAITMIIADAKEMEREQIEEAFYNARKNKSDCQIWNCEGSQKAYETFNEYYNETFNP
jgi:hypothetical protein